MNLVNLVKDQKEELESRFSSIDLLDRELEDFFGNVLKSKLIKVVTGVRRAGKSVLCYKFLRNKKFAYFNFDDERFLDFKANDILSAFYEIYGKDFKFIFLDEIQILDNWQLFVNRLHRMGFNLFITGSNATLLSKELATHLTGRHLTIELFPLSFREYLTSVNFKEDIGTTKGVSIIKKELTNYLENGGFPEIVIEKENAKFYLRELYTRIVERDIIQRYNISYKKTFREIALTLLSNPSKLISYNKLKNQFNLGSDHTIKNYLNYLEEAYVFFFISKYSFKPVEIEKSQKKIYSIDTGIISNLSLKNSLDFGAIYENAVALELLRQKSFNPRLEIYYWKNQLQEEVDFIIKEETKIKQLIQVSYNLNELNTKKRELKALLKAAKELKCTNLIIINKEIKKEEKIQSKKIKIIPLHEWLKDTKLG